MEKWKKVAWSDELQFILHYVDGPLVNGAKDGTRMHYGKNASLKVKTKGAFSFQILVNNCMIKY